MTGMQNLATVAYQESLPIATPVADPCLLLADLELFRQDHGMAEIELAEWLEVTLSGLAVLAQSARPNVADLSFTLHCQWLAYRSGCDCFSLRALLRWVHGGG